MSPRNSSGSYSTPSPGVPFQSGQVLNSANMNATLVDLGNEIGSSLDRAGRGGLLAPLRGVDGTVAAPAVAFTSETSSGLYKAAAGDIRVAVGGVDALKLASGGVAGPVNMPSGAGVTATGTDSPVTMKGNLSATNLNGDVAITSTATRTAGQLLDVQNNGVGKFQVDYQGLARLVSQAAAIQPASLWTAITPGTGWTAGGGLAYWKDSDGIVHLKGNVLGSTGSAIFATLPAGFRPAATRGFSIPWSGTAPPAANDGFYFAQVLTNGTLSAPVNSAGTTWYLDGVNFLAEA